MAEGRKNLSYSEKQRKSSLEKKQEGVNDFSELWPSNE